MAVTFLERECPMISVTMDIYFKRVWIPYTIYYAYHRHGIQISLSKIASVISAHLGQVKAVISKDPGVIYSTPNVFTLSKKSMKMAEIMFTLANHLAISLYGKDIDTLFKIKETKHSIVNDVHIDYLKLIGESLKLLESNMDISEADELYSELKVYAKNVNLRLKEKVQSRIVYINDIITTRIKTKNEEREEMNNVDAGN